MHAYIIGYIFHKLEGIFSYQIYKYPRSQIVTEKKNKHDALDDDICPQRICSSFGIVSMVRVSARGGQKQP